MYQLNDNDYAAYYRPYMEGLPSSDILTFLENQKQEVLSFLQTIPEEKWNHAYAPGKWTIKEVCGHVLDSEIIFGYRTLCIARGELASLPGYDENSYVENGHYNDLDYQQIIQTWLKARALNLSLFESISEEAWQYVGTANNNRMKAGAVPFIIAGHTRHHMRIIKERYL